MATPPRASTASPPPTAAPASLGQRLHGEKEGVRTLYFFFLAGRPGSAIRPWRNRSSPIGWVQEPIKSATWNVLLERELAAAATPLLPPIGTAGRSPTPLASIIPPHLEPVEFPGWVFLDRPAFLHPRPGRSGSAPVQKLGDRLGFSFRKDFHPAVREITDPAGEPETLGLVMGRRPEKHSLDFAGHIDMNPPAHCSTSSASRKISCRPHRPISQQ
jgi:hypothetical protein